jgi:hypothetical protein
MTVLYSEIGDISGKFGVAYPSTGTLKFTGGTFVDYYPPLIANYQADVTNSIMWSSVIFHCGTSTAPRLICAKLSSTDTSACSSSYTAFSDSGDDDDNLSSGGIGGIAAGSFIFILIIVAIAVFYNQRMRKGPLSEQGRDSVNY